MIGFKERLKDARISVGLTQIAMASKVGVARQTYLDLESGKTVPRIDTVARLAFILGINRSYLAYGDEDLPNVTAVKKELNKVINMLDNI